MVLKVQGWRFGRSSSSFHLRVLAPVRPGNRSLMGPETPNIMISHDP